jgi:hypothetical protein
MGMKIQVRTVFKPLSAMTSKELYQSIMDKTGSDRDAKFATQIYMYNRYR